MGAWATDVVTCTEAALRALADPVRAGPMRAYMRDQFPFLGITSPPRRAAQREAWTDLAAPTQGELLDAAGAMWAIAERELQYAAVDLVRRFNRVLDPDALDGGVRALIQTKSWWDTVDGLQSAAVEPLVSRHPQLEALMREWVAHDDRWLVRSAIIHQLHRKTTTNAGLLFALCAARAGDREFFVAKAIGWALRSYARTDPVAVERFVAAHPDLQPLSRREALKGVRAPR